MTFPSPMSVSEAVRRRRSARAFRSDPVDHATLRRLIEGAMRAPSNGNLQPWHVYAVTGEPLVALKRDVATSLAATKGKPPVPEYAPYPTALWEPQRSYRREAGRQRYAALGHTDRSSEGEWELLERNFRLFDAPVGLFFSLDRRVTPSQWLDLGAFLQTLLLLATEAGLAACPQAIWSGMSEVVGRHTGLSKERMLVCGMALGYPDPDHPLSGFETGRAALDEICTFVCPPDAVSQQRHTAERVRI